MRSRSEPSCRSCGMRSACRPDDDAGGADAAAGWRLAGLAAGYFLGPLVAAVVAAAAVEAGPARILAGLSALGGALVAAAVAGALLRRRTTKRNS